MQLIRLVLAVMLALQLGGLPAVASEVCQAPAETDHSCCLPEERPAGLNADTLCGCCLEPALPAQSNEGPVAATGVRDSAAVSPGSPAAALPVAAVRPDASLTAPALYSHSFPPYLDGSGFRC